MTDARWECGTGMGLTDGVVNAWQGRSQWTEDVDLGRRLGNIRGLQHVITSSVDIYLAEDFYYFVFPYPPYHQELYDLSHPS